MRLLLLILAAVTLQNATAADLAVSSYSFTPAAGFPDSTGTELTDGAFANPASFNDAAWTAWQNTQPVVTFDLGSAQSVNGVTVHYLDSTGQAGGTIRAPSAITVTYSTDNISYSTAGSFSGTTTFPKPGGNTAVSAPLTFTAVTARYVKLTITRSTQWLFFDEMSIQGTSGPAITSLTGGNTFVFNNERFTVGYEFTVSQPVVVEALGFFDQGNDGLATSHPVGIWNSSAQLVATGTVPAGTDGALQSVFRYVSITPVTLPAGTYRAGALVYNGGGNDAFLYNITTVATNALVTYVQSRAGVSNDLVLHYPNYAGAELGLAEKGMVGPNFKLSPAPQTPPPTVSVANATVSVNEGSAAADNGSYASGNGNAVTLSASAGTLTQNGTTSGTYTWSATPADGPASSNVVITATGSDSSTATVSFALNVTNVAPTVTLTGNASVAQGAAYLLTLSAAVDPGTDTVTGGTINWGDGASQTFTGNPSAVSTSHTYATGGSKTITVSLTDEDGTYSLAGSKTITVNGPPLLAVNEAAVSAIEGTDAVNAGTYSDPNGNGTVTLTASIGAITTDPASGVWGWSHEIASYFPPTTVVITATDSTGLTATVSFTLSVPDTRAPVFTSPRVNLTEVARPDGTVVVTFTAPVATDEVDGPVSVVCDPPSGTAFPVGENAVACTAMDSQGNSNSTFFVVTVLPLDYFVSTTGGAIVLTDLSGHSDALEVREIDEERFEFNVPGRTFRVDQLAARTDGSGSLFLTGVTSVTINAGNGNDVITVGGFARKLFPSLTINGGAGDDTVLFNGTIHFAAGAVLDTDLQNDDAAPGIDRIILSPLAQLLFPEDNNGSVTMKVSRNVELGPLSQITTGAGSLTIEANQQATPTTGDFVGILGEQATIEAAGSSPIIMKGKGGTTAGGTLARNGSARTNGAAADPELEDANSGIKFTAQSQIKQGGNGAVILEGTSVANGDNAAGVQLENSSVGTEAGNLQLSGYATGTGSGNNRPGVNLTGANGAKLSVGGLGEIAITAQGAPGAGDGNAGLVLEGSGSITVEDGDLTIVGQGGQGDNSTPGADRPGVMLKGALSATGDGAISLEGKGGISSEPGQDGIAADGSEVSGGAPLIATTSGDVALMGESTGSGASLMLDSSGAVIVASESGDVALYGDHISIVDSTASGVGVVDVLGDLTFAAVTPSAPPPVTLTPDTVALLSAATLIVNTVVTNTAPGPISLSSSSVVENNAPNTTIGLLSATDPDNPAAGQTLSFSLAAGAGDTHNSSFAINGNQLILTSSADFEQLPSYSVRVQVSDGAGGVREQILAVSVTDVADNNPPAFSNYALAGKASKPLFISMSELLSHASDSDGGTPIITAVTTETAHGGVASLDASGVTYRPPNNFIGSDTFTLALADGQGGISHGTVTITLAQINEAATDILLSVSQLNENNSANAMVGSLSALDPDYEDTHSFALVNGAGDTDNASFTITGETLRLIPSANYEAKNSYTLRVRATDNGGLYYEKVFNVTIVNVSDTELESWRQLYFGSFENAGPGANENDYDGDGIRNDLEFAIGTNPKTYNAMPGVLTLNGNTLEFTYQRAKAALIDGFSFAVQFRADLFAGDWSTSEVTDVLVTQDTNSEQRKATVAVPSPASGEGLKGFMRLLVTPAGAP